MLLDNMNNYESKKFDKHIQEYMLRYKNIKQSIDSLTALISQNKEIHPPHKQLMLNLLKEICNDVVIGNQNLVSAFDTMGDWISHMQDLSKRF